MLIKFNDNTQLNCLSVTGMHKSITGIRRDCLTFNFNNSKVSPEEILNKFRDENALSIITIENTETNEGYSYADYVVFDEMTVKNESVKSDSEDNKNITVISVTVGRLTYSEKAQKDQKEQLENISEVIADMLGGAI